MGIGGEVAMQSIWIFND